MRQKRGKKMMKFFFMVGSDFLLRVEVSEK